jgi:hypothetical protein
MREFHGSLEEATLLLRCMLALGDEGIGPANAKNDDGTLLWDESVDAEIFVAAARKAWRQFSPYQLEELCVSDVVPAGAVWDVESWAWRT